MKYENGRWYRVRVTKKNLGVLLDDEQVLDLDTECKKLDMRIGEVAR